MKKLPSSHQEEVLSAIYICAAGIWWLAEIKWLAILLVLKSLLDIFCSVAASIREMKESK